MEGPVPVTRLKLRYGGESHRLMNQLSTYDKDFAFERAVMGDLWIRQHYSAVRLRIMINRCYGAWGIDLDPEPT